MTIDFSDKGIRSGLAPSTRSVSTLRAQSLSTPRALRGRIVSALVAVIISPAVFFPSCGGGGDGVQQGYEIDRNFRRGPVSFRVAVSREEITIADRVTMLMEARAEDGYSVEFPGFGEKLEQFGIVDYSTPPPELEKGGVVVTRRTYELEPFLSGEYRIPPMMITFHQEGDTTLHTLESDTILVSVTSILPEDHAGLEIKDIAGPVSFPANRAYIFIAAGCVIAIAAAIILIRRYRRRRSEEAYRVPPHEIAYMRLEKLLSSGLIEEKRYREFTAEVSDILRHYIEDRFGLRAPERTTEEFLAEAGEGLPVDSRHKDILGDFLLHCDLVKFAAMEPSAEDVKRTFETCRDFVDTTKPREEVKAAAA